MGDSCNGCFVFCTPPGDTQLRPRREWRDAVLGVRLGRRGNDKKLQSGRIKLETVTPQRDGINFLSFIHFYPHGRAPFNPRSTHPPPPLVPPHRRRGFASLRIPFLSPYSVSHYFSFSFRREFCFLI